MRRVNVSLRLHLPPASVVSSVVLLVYADFGVAQWIRCDFPGDAVHIRKLRQVSFAVGALVICGLVRLYDYSVFPSVVISGS